MAIDLKEFNRMRKAVKEFQAWQKKMGIETKGYNLKSPWSR